MRVLFITTSIGLGGAEVMLDGIVGRMNRNGIICSVISLTSEISETWSILPDLGVPVHKLRISRGRFSLWDLVQVWQLGKLIRDFRPDIVQTWMYHANLIGGLVSKFCFPKVPICWSLHHTEITLQSRRTRNVIAISSLFSKVLPTRILSCSWKGINVHTGLGYPQDKMVYIPNGVDVVTFRPSSEHRESVRCEWSFPEDLFVIGMVSRYDPIKDFPNFVMAASLVAAANPNVRFVLCGKQVKWENQELRNLICSTGLKEFFLLLGERTDIPRIMNGFDLYCLSSKSESFPMVLIEAMATGIPCVSTDVGDCHSIIGDLGVTVPINAPNSLADACLQMLGLTAEVRRALGRKSRARVMENFSIDRIAQKYMGIYTDLICAHSLKRKGSE